ncbi:MULTISPECIES: TspO/MBR family protein [Alphaproteobacteria]|uniref:Tryptophan-rich sensory protein n=2 Tax=Alphaproteobacteria TaxID=28211 RepID=A0A512HE43_9HYPH|nr:MULTISPECIES: TspO/MBR family protein [Alphaproteobacteria]GEO83719.1 tryptophan-rich sensory protein [Ciceribacter naphthalenivorans]GLR24129.1 tryptophan-rich sensory protein [Ciceribacter naphthalenivorans]GLT06985.1 tryptophan-rich sensory protein [Sphingomonas psychrolutea]
MRKVVIYSVFIAGVVILGILSGVSNMPSTWYQSLEKPFFNPPPWVFAPVWTLLYVMIGIAGARVWLKAPASAAMQIWFAQIALNALWSSVFFGLEAPGLALLVIVGLLVTILGFLWKAGPIDRPARLLFTPYLAWVSFATLLNASIFLMN